MPATPPGKAVALAPWTLVRISADGAYAAVSNPAGAVEIVPVAGGAPVKLADNALNGETVWLFRSPTAGFAAMDGIDASTSLGTLKLWTPATGVVTLSSGVLFPRFSPDGKYLGWLDRSVKPYVGYLLEIGAAAPTMVAADVGSVTFSFSADSKWIVGSHGAPAKVWAAPTATVATVTPMGGFVRFVAGHRLLYVGEVAAERGRLALYDADSGTSTDIHGRRRCGRTRRRMGR